MYHRFEPHPSGHIAIGLADLSTKNHESGSLYGSLLYVVR